MKRKSLDVEPADKCCGESVSLSVSVGVTKTGSWRGKYGKSPIPRTKNQSRVYKYSRRGVSHYPALTLALKLKLASLKP